VTDAPVPYAARVDQLLARHAFCGNSSEDGMIGKHQYGISVERYDLDRRAFAQVIHVRLEGKARSTRSILPAAIFSSSCLTTCRGRLLLIHRASRMWRAFA
jgi:hypothetical protein